MQYEVALDTRPQFLTNGLLPVLTPAAQAKTVSDDNTGSTVGAVNGLQDVQVATRVTTQGADCKLPLVYKCVCQILNSRVFSSLEKSGCSHMSHRELLGFSFLGESQKLGIFSSFAQPMCRWHDACNSPCLIWMTHEGVNGALHAALHALDVIGLLWWLQGRAGHRLL